MALFRELLLWLDAETVRYWTVAWLAFLTSAGLAWFAGTAEHAKRTFPWFILSVPLTLAAFRWPSWFYPLDLNPDEAQIVAGALTLHRFPIMWKHLDTTTHGPLCELALVIASWLGAPFSYVSARIVAVLMQAATLLAVCRTIRVFASEQLARLAILPGLAFWSFVSWDDFVHYSSELPGLCLLALGTWSATRGFAKDLGRNKQQIVFFIAGLCLGAVPFGKLQSAPQALATAVLVGGLCWCFIKTDRGKLLRLLIAGLATPSLMVGAYVLFYGQAAQFWFTYVQSAIDFLDMAPHRLSAMPGRFLHFSATSPAFAWFFWGNLSFALLYLRGGNNMTTLRAAVLAAWGLAAVAFFCVLKPARETAHYLHLLIAPLTTLTGFTLARACAETDQTSRQILRWRPLLAFAALTLAPQIYDRVVSWNRFAGYTWEYLTRAPSAAAAYIKQFARPDDTMAMWGWEPHLLVEVQMPHATREAQSGNQLMQWSMTHFFVERYVADMQRWQPAWFVDAVGPGAFIFADRATMGHESIPALREIITNDYDLMTEMGNKRIYRRKSVIPR